MTIRPFRPGDAAPLAQVLHDAVHGLGAGHYTPAQLSAWSPAPMTPAHFTARHADGRMILVAEDASGAPCAFIDLTGQGHIDRLFCRPDIAGRGLAAALYDRLEAEARHRRLARLTVEASLTARPFFLARGFTDLGRQAVRRAGITLHNHRMAKELAPALDP